ncbi:MAG: hypothetical protein ACYDBV_09785, partial [Nitrospiria bacterium]
MSKKIFRNVLAIVSLMIFTFVFSPKHAFAEEEKPLKPVPKAYSTKHMPKGWWTDPTVIAEGKKIFETAKNEVESMGKKEEIKEGCSTCHAIDPAKDRPKKRGARDFREA